MRCVDVNVLVYAHRADVPDHEMFHAWLHTARVAVEPLGLADLVLSGFMRVVTHPRIFRDPPSSPWRWPLLTACDGHPLR